MRPNMIQGKKLDHSLISEADRQYRGMCDSSHRLGSGISQGKGWVLWFFAEVTLQAQTGES